MFARNFLARFIVTGSYSGLSPLAPGTTGSIACLLLWIVLCRMDVLGTVPAQVLAAAGCFVVGLVATDYYLRTSFDGVAEFVADPSLKQFRDPGFIVIDEWAGMLIALVGLHNRPAALALAAFALFRMFDIIKPWPVGYLEQLPGAWGIMLDDVAAGFLAWLVLHIVLTFAG